MKAKHGELRCVSCIQRMAAGMMKRMYMIKAKGRRGSERPIAEEEDRVRECVAERCKSRGVSCVVQG